MSSSIPSNEAEKYFPNVTGKAGAVKKKGDPNEMFKVKIDATVKAQMDALSLEIKEYLLGRKNELKDRRIVDANFNTAMELKVPGGWRRNFVLVTNEKGQTYKVKKDKHSDAIIAKLIPQKDRGC